MSADRRSTTSPISATRGRSSCSTCCFGCCATSMAPRMSPMCATSPMSTTRSSRPRSENGEAIRDADRAHRSRPIATTWRPSARSPPTASRAHRAYRAADGRDDRGADRQGLAYEAEGHVLFHVPAMADYGQLSRPLRDDMIAGARVEVAPYKKHPADFVLWKPSTARRSRAGTAPGAAGRPGWHIECSAMGEGPARARPSTFMAAASTSSFRTTRTRSRRAAAPMTVRRWRATGCTTASCR